MAKLSSDLLTLEIHFKSFHHGWVEYDIRWHWDGAPVLNNAIFKRASDNLSAGLPGSIFANEHRADFFICTIEKVLESGEPGFFETSDPDVTLAVYPGNGFPFVADPGLRLIWESDAVKAERERRERLKARLGKLPDDLFCLMMCVDVYNFRKCGAYAGDWVCLKMLAYRETLENFCRELRREYFAFKAKWNVDEYSIQQIGEEDARTLPLFGNGFEAGETE